MAVKKNGASQDAPETLPAVVEAAGVPSLVGDAVPEWARGASGVAPAEARDITLPLIKIGQGTSEEVKSGLVKEGDFFLNVTRQTLAEAGKPLNFVILARSIEYILWKDRKFEGGGIMTRAHYDGVGYAWQHPYTKFNNKIDGKIPVVWETKKYVGRKGDPDNELYDNLGQWNSEIPGQPKSGIAATAHYNLVVYLLDYDQIAGFSLSRSQVKPAQDLNGIIDLMGRQKKLCSRAFRAITLDKTNQQGQKYKNLLFQPNGYVQDAELGAYLLQQTERFNAGFEIDQTGNNEGGDAAPSDGKF
jgi:hypothetical protein